MAIEHSPAFQFYVKEWRSSRAILRMTFAQRGMYLEMLLEQWENLTLPDDPGQMAELIGGTVAEWTRNWEPLRRRFVTDNNGRIYNVRLEKERAKQRGSRGGGKKRAEAAARGADGTFQPAGHPAAGPADHPAPTPAAEPATSSVAFPIAFPIALATPDTPTTARSKRPIYTGQKLTVFEWQLDDCMKTLGSLIDRFDLHEWFDQLDQQCFAANVVIPQRDGGVWLQAQLVAEAQKRGLPLVVAGAPKAGKQTTNLAAAVANIRRTEAR